MSITSARRRSRIPPPAARPGRSGARLARRHDEAVIQAEIRRLARALRPYGVLHRDALERAAGAWRWQEGGFDRALGAAVRSGAIERLPANFYRSAPDSPGREARGG